MASLVARCRPAFSLQIAAVFALAVAATPEAAPKPVGHVGGEGKFKVGHVMIQIVHTSSTGERRPIDVMVWYPANSKDWETGIPSIYRPRLWGVTLIPGVWDPLGFQIEAILARDNVPIAKGPKAFPLVIHSHGNGLEPLVAAEISELIASHGYVVAAPYHTGNTADDARTTFVNNTAGRQVLGCLDGLPRPCVDGAGKTIADRVLDLRAIMDNIDDFLGDGVDSSRVAVFGHSRGGLTALAAAGGSTTFGAKRLDDRLKGLVAWSNGTRDLLLNVDLAQVKIPALLIASSGDDAIPTALMREAYGMLSSKDKALFELKNAAHLSITSGLCSALQSAGSRVLDNPRAFLDERLLINRLNPIPSADPAYEYCDYSDFTTPTDITTLVQAFSSFSVTPTNVPTTLSADDVVRVTSQLSVSFFNVVLKGCGHFSDGGYLNPEFMLKKEPDAVLSAEATYLPSDHRGRDNAANCDND